MKRRPVLILLAALGTLACVLAVIRFTSGSDTAPATPDDKAVQNTIATEAPSPVAQIAPAVRPVPLPTPPAPLPLPSASPEQQATALATAVEPSSPDRLAGWLAVYDALRIPVLGPGRSPIGTTGDDPIGPAFWRVWYMAGMTRPGTGFRLTDLAKAFNSPAEPSYDSGQAGALLLEDLRNAIRSSDPQVQLFGHFTAAMVKRGPRSADLLDPKVTADQVVISGDLAELLSWVVVRDLVFALTPPKTSLREERPYRTGPGGAGSILVSWRAVSPASGEPRAPFARSGAPASAQQGCTSLVDEDTSYWLNWALNKVVGGGVQLPGMTTATKGLVEYIQLKDGISGRTIDRTKKVTNIASTVANLLTLAMQISSLTLDSIMEPEPLERTKGTSDGKQARIYFRLMYDPGRLPDGNNLAACISSYLLNAFGVSFNFPSSGRVPPGVELTFEGGQGFGEYVLFGDYKQLRMPTNSNGEVELLVLGKAQPKQVPDQAKPVRREFSIHVSAQPEAVTFNTLANIFFDGLTVGAAPDVAGAINAAVDIAKTFHWDLGERIYSLTDWATIAYRVNLPWPAPWNGAVRGTICSLEEPFKLQSRATATEIEIIEEFTFTPSGPGRGSWSSTGEIIVPDEEGTITGGGNYWIEERGGSEGVRGVDPAGGATLLHMPGQRVAAGGGVSFRVDGLTFPLEPVDLSGDECSSQ